MVSAPTALRGDVFLVDLSPTRGGEIRKARPCLVISPDELNSGLSTFLIAPMTTGAHACRFRVPCRFQGKSGHVVTDQVRAVDRERLVRRLGRIAPGTLSKVLVTLREMFAD